MSIICFVFVEFRLISGWRNDSLGGEDWSVAELRSEVFGRETVFHVAKLSHGDVFVGVNTIDTGIGFGGGRGIVAGVDGGDIFVLSVGSRPKEVCEDSSKNRELY